MASTQIGLTINGKDSTKSAFDSVSKSISKIGTEAGKAGSTVGSSLSKGASQASAAFSSLGSSASRTFGMIQAGAGAASSSLGGIGSAVGSLLGGFTALQAAQMAWTGASQREFNEMYLRTKMAGGAADQYLDTISQIVAQVPGDDTWMNSLLTGALARETSLSADMLQRLGTTASKYVIAAQQTGASILPVNAERELSSYIKTGNTGLMIRDGLLKNHVAELEKAKTPSERILALEKAMTEEGFQQMDIAALTSAKWEEIKGRIQLAATNVGSKLLPFVERLLDFVTDLDDKTSGWASTIAFVGVALTGLAVAIAPLVTATIAAWGAMKAYRIEAQLAGKSVPSIGKASLGSVGGIGLGTVAFTVALGVITAVAAWEVADNIVNELDKFFYNRTSKEKELMTEQEKRQVMTSRGQELDKQAMSALNNALNTAKQNLGSFGETWGQLSGKATGSIATISSAWGGLKSYVGAGITGTVKAVQNTFSGVYSAARSLYNYVSNGATGLVRVITSGISSAWASINSLYNTVRAGATGVVTTIRQFISMGPAGAAGPAGPLDDMNFHYESYAGSKKDAWRGTNNMSGNCVDMTQGLINRYGGSMVQGTWNGGDHVWWRAPNGKEFDPARKALNNTFRPPSRGPGDGMGSNIIIQGDVYGFDDFAKKVEQANNKIVVGVF